MAKQKKKKYKHKKSYPPLSKLDKATYYFSAIVPEVLLLGIPLGYECFSPYFVFKNSEALAFCSTNHFWRIIPFLFVILVLFIISGERLTSKKPIFGNKKIDYYNTTLYKSILPPFDKRYIKKFWTKDKIKKAFIKTIITAIIITVTFVYGIGGVVSRWEITNSNIIKYGTINQIEESYTYDNISSYRVYSKISSVGAGKGTRTYYPELGLTVTLDNGETLSFNLDFINSYIYGFYKLDNLLSGIKKTVDDNDLERYIEQHTLSDEELKTLKEIYSE